MSLRVAAIGYGDIAQRRHFPQLQALPNVELAAIAGRDPARLAACAVRFGIARTFTEPATMLADPEIDAVLVLTPPDTHARYAELAIRAGKHVLVEKPLVPTLAAAQHLRTVLQSCAPVTFMALPFYATPELRLVENLLHADAVGEVTMVETHRGHRGPTHAGWFYRKELSGGGALADLGIYQLTLIAALFGPAATMSAQLSTRFAQRILDDGTTVAANVEDCALLTLALGNGIAVSLNANWTGAVTHHATRGRTTVFGRDGILHFGVADGAVYLYRPDASNTEGEVATFDGYACRRFTPPGAGAPPSIAAEFVARIRAGDTALRDLDIQAHVLDIIATAYEPSLAGRTVALTTGF